MVTVPAMTLGDGKAKSCEPLPTIWLAASKASAVTRADLVADGRTKTTRLVTPGLANRSVPERAKVCREMVGTALTVNRTSRICAAIERQLGSIVRSIATPRLESQPT